MTFLCPKCGEQSELPEGHLAECLGAGSFMVQCPQCEAVFDVRVQLYEMTASLPSIGVRSGVSGGLK